MVAVLAITIYYTDGGVLKKDTYKNAYLVKGAKNIDKARWTSYVEKDFKYSRVHHGIPTKDSPVEIEWESNDQYLYVFDKSTDLGRAIYPIRTVKGVKQK